MKEKIESMLFNGYVIEPIPIFAVGLAVLLAFWGLSVYMTVDFFFLEKNVVTGEATCCFVSYAVDGPVYEIETSGNGVLYLPQRTMDEVRLVELIQEKTLLTVTYTYSSDQKIPRKSILEICSENGVEVPQETIASAEAEDAHTNLLIQWSACLCFSAFLAGGYYILCNAPRYPRLAAMLIRKPFRNF